MNEHQNDQTHLTIETLGDYVDGVLDETTMRDVEMHLGRCAPCRTDLARLRELLAGAAALPDSIEPPAEVWSNVRASVERAKTAALPSASTRRAGAWWTDPRMLSIAATILVVATVSATVVTMRVMHTVPSTVRTAVHPTASVEVPASLVAIEKDYLPDVDRLSSVLRAKRGELAPKTVATVEHSLRVIDQAIEEARTALIQDPANHDIAELLSANYQRKLDLLRRASQLVNTL